jgi:hypothetical protein
MILQHLETAVTDKGLAGTLKQLDGLFGKASGVTGV